MTRHTLRHATALETIRIAVPPEFCPLVCVIWQGFEPHMFKAE